MLRIDERFIRRIALTALTGTTIEWYDFFLYGTAAALICPAVFFPADMPAAVALLASFSTFAVGFVARPLGGIVFGHFGDRVGRKKALVVALIMMGLATTLIGCLPSYASLGAAAPVLLIVLRFVQGIAIGGQWGGAVLIATENAPPARRGFYGSFAQVGAPAGVILSNLAFLLVTANTSQQAFMHWGWRLPFLFSITLIAVALFVQLRLEDTAAFLKLRQTGQGREGQLEAHAATKRERRRSPVLEALRTHPKQIALVAGASLAVQVPFYILIAFVVAYGTGAMGPHVSRSMMLAAVLVGAVVMVPSLLIAAVWSDRYGRRGIYMAGAALLAAWSFAVFPLLDTGSFLWICVGIGVAQVFVAMMYGPQAAFVSEMFSTDVRYSGASLGYQLGAILGGAFAPIIATALLAEYHRTVGISIYMAIACAITIVSIGLLRETAGSNMEKHPVAGRGGDASSGAVFRDRSRNQGAEADASASLIGDVP
jgi:MFS family permease